MPSAKKPDPETFEDARAPCAPETRPAEPHWFVVLECDRPTAGGARFALKGADEVVVGRGERRGARREVEGGVVRLVVDIPGRSMSSTHARVRRTEAGWLLEDNASTNGSFVDGKRVERTLLRDGAVAELGHTLFTLRTALPTPLETPAHYDSELAPNATGVSATLLPELAAEFATIPRVARSKLPLLLLGESGTGKELLGRAIHAASERPGPFVALNCGALSPNLIESQLFGHVRGAFSGALRDEPGFVRAADGGTLLLDEIGDLGAGAQGALLRALQEQEIVPVGSARPVPVDVRFLAATHRSLDTLVKQRAFRGDLLARLDGFRYRLPPLASRLEDIGLIVAALLCEESAGGVTLARDAGTALLLHAWPFNVRELLQCLRRAVVLAAGGTIGVEHLALPGGDEVERRSSRRAPRSLGAEDVALKQELVRQLERHAGNVSEVARAMGKARMQVQRWIKRFSIELGGFRRD